MVEGSGGSANSSEMRGNRSIWWSQTVGAKQLRRLMVILCVRIDKVSLLLLLLMERLLSVLLIMIGSYARYSLCCQGLRNQVQFGNFLWAIQYILNVLNY